jgi:outer membrane protein assembly factor BamB
VLVIVTEHNSVYAFDARTYAQLWHVNLGKPQLGVRTSAAAM